MPFTCPDANVLRDPHRSASEPLVRVKILHAACVTVLNCIEEVLEKVIEKELDREVAFRIIGSQEHVISGTGFLRG